MSNKNIKLATENVTKFDGTVDFETWYRKFVASMDAWNIDDKDRYMALVLVLDQDVLTRIMAECREAGTLPEERTDKWFVAELRKRFAYEKTILKRFLDFLERKKQKEETLEGYLVVKRQLYLSWLELWKADKVAQSDNGSLFLEAAIEGLPKALHATVKLKHPPDSRKFDDLLRSARDLQGLEASRMEGRSEPPKLSSPSGTSKRKTVSPPSKDSECYHCGEKGHHKWQCPKLRDEKKRSATSRKYNKDVSAVHGATGTRRYVVLELDSNGRSSTVRALVDTGASMTVIARSVAEKISTQKQWLKFADGPVQAANGTAMEVLGKLQVTGGGRI